MKILTYFIAFFIAAIVNLIIKSTDIAYLLATAIGGNDVSGTALLAGLFSGIFTVIPLGLAFYISKKIIKNREAKKFRTDAIASGMTEFEYAKSITSEKIINYCDSHIDGPVYTVIDKINRLPDEKVISRPCADALIEGYTKLMSKQHNGT